MSKNRHLATIVERLQSWFTCFWKGHNWLVTVDPVTFETKQRICRNCLKTQKSRIRWRREW